MATFLFTDIEASTRRWEHDAPAMSTALERHDAVVRDAVASNRGSLLKHTGDGVIAVFEMAADALSAAIAIQRTLTDDDVRVRAGLHTGPAEQRDNDYFGPTLNRAARIMGLGRGGHVLVSTASAAMIGTDTPTDTSLLDLGEQPLKGFEQPERVFQAVGAGLVSDRAVGPSAISAMSGGRTAFVGREAEVVKLAAMLERDRCVTITGVGGTGKTRLALEVALRILDRFSDGVAVVELAALADPDEVARSVADAVAMPVVASSVDRDLMIFLRERDCLLVLDNCEHILDACADLVDALIENCPRVTVLATSREALGIEGERSWRAPSLSLPSNAEDVDPLECESAALFIARASVVRPDFDATKHRAAIAEICRRLDGLPLAIELAAARASHLTPDQIAEMLDNRFRLLTGGARRARQRQQTLQAAMDWSHDLLSDDERRLLRQLSVFAGGWTLDAAIAVCGSDDPVAVIDGLGSLVAKSLVNVDEIAGSSRYRTLETVRLYAQDRLVDAGESEELRDRHRDWLVQWILASWSTTGSFDGARRRLEPELENLRAALDWSREQNRGEQITMLICRSWPMWYLGLRSFEALAWLDSYAMGVDATLSTADRVDCRIARGFLLQETMNGSEIARCGEEALALDPEGTASSLTGLAWFLRMMVPVVADPDLAVQIGNEALAWVDTHGAGETADMVRAYWANALIADDRWADARIVLTELIDRDALDGTWLHYVQSGLAATCHALGANDEAKAHLRAAIDSLTDSPGRHADTSAYSLLAIVEAASGNRQASRRALSTSVDCVRRRYGHIPTAWGLPITAAAIILAIDERDDEAMQLMVAVGAHGRIWQARQEHNFLLHKLYSQRLGHRMTPEAIGRAWTAGDEKTVDEMHAAVDALAAES